MNLSIPMKKLLPFLAFTVLLGLQIHAQTCASPFAPGATVLTEVCTPTGAANYPFSVTATSDSTLEFWRLWSEPMAIAADVDCNTQTFTIARQFLLVGYEIQGQGNISGNFIQVFYGVHETSTGNLVDSCAGYYQAVIVGTRAPVQSQLLVYPNPATSQAYLRWTGQLADAGSCKYLIVDLQGRAVAEGSLDTNLEAKLELKALSKGMYRVVVIAHDEGTLTSHVLVVQ
jgi:Secretion system C-terminal sorting domain